MRFSVVRDPLWNNIRLDEEALAVLDTPPIQRLRYVRQLGYAFLVYPGATHTRFEHALGAYHLAGRALTSLRERSSDWPLTPQQERQCRLAALLHDVGHYPFSHALEEAGLPHHEALAQRHLGHPALRAALERTAGSDGTEQISALIQGRSTSPVAGLISGSVDLDKIEYLTRDGAMCGVPYGGIDVDRLLGSLCLVDTDRWHIGIHEKGLSALESLLFSKYQLFRNVYWHHAVRAATCMFKRMVRSAIRDESITVDAIAVATDDGLLHELASHDRTGLARALRERSLMKRILDIPATDVPESDDWLAAAPDLTERVEDQVASELGVPPGTVLMDFPVKPKMMSIDLPLVRKDQRVEMLTDAGRAGHLGLPRIAEELYHTARRYRVFAAQPLEVPAEAMVTLAALPRSEVERRLSRGEKLLN